MGRGIGFVLAFVVACSGKEPVQESPPPAIPPPPKEVESISVPALVAARETFRTTIIEQQHGRDPAEQPPASGPFQLVKYEAAPGKLAAYITKDPGDGLRHPAIVWLHGGDTNEIGDLWTPMPPRNDQSAAQYREAGIVMMMPSLRGGNDNPGRREGFYGEVDDVLAAAKYLKTLPYVDPARVYLGGHSTGGTLALLVAAAAPRFTFRAAIAFGAVSSPLDYGAPNEFSPFDLGNDNEVLLRSPVMWMNSIIIPTFVLEGEAGNASSVDELRKLTRNRRVKFLTLKGHDHFSVLAPTNHYFAAQMAGPWQRGFVELDDVELRRAVEITAARE